MDIEVRRATAADAVELHELAAATFALACPPGTRQADIDDFIQATPVCPRTGERTERENRASYGFMFHEPVLPLYDCVAIGAHFSYDVPPGRGSLRWAEKKPGEVDRD